MGYHKGSILSPLLLLIYINDLCIVCKSTEPVLFADDTNLFSSGSNAISLQDGVNNDLSIIAEWLKVNKISLNIKKTHFMCFSAKINLSQVYLCKLMGKPLLKSINQNSRVWLLTINWVGKIIYHLLCRKVARDIGVIIKARKVLRNESLQCLHYSFIYPYMIYCNQVWGSACETNIEPYRFYRKEL